MMTAPEMASPKVLCLDYREVINNPIIANSPLRLGHMTRTLPVKFIFKLQNHILRYKNDLRNGRRRFDLGTFRRCILRLNFEPRSVDKMSLVARLY